MGLADLIQKYAVSGPRYTSYPTAPHFTDLIGREEYRSTLHAIGRSRDPFSLYIHLPFCEALCYYCGCNIQITKEHTRSRSYIEALVKEMQGVADSLKDRVFLSQVAWGGGTPTFLSVAEIRQLHEAIRRIFLITNDAEVSIEIDPRVTTEEQLSLLRELGFNRVSLGVQDFESSVQKAVHRVQSVKQTEEMLTYCRKQGYSGINFDLIYGLPHQTFDSFVRTVEQVLQMKPDRIALYNYAHLPTLRPHQKILEKYPMPAAQTRLEIFEKAYELFTQNGYRNIGMDHFALENDELYKALGTDKLYRNFQGYTVKRGAGLIGIGASAIGEVGGFYFQNLRGANEYEASVSEKGLATFRGIKLSHEDKERKWIIQSLMCQFKLDFNAFEENFSRPFLPSYPKQIASLAEFERDGLLECQPWGIRATELGRLFIRNTAMIFDAYLERDTSATYSKTV